MTRADLSSKLGISQLVLSLFLALCAAVASVAVWGFGLEQRTAVLESVMKSQDETDKRLERQSGDQVALLRDDIKALRGDIRTLDNKIDRFIERRK